MLNLPVVSWALLVGQLLPQGEPSPVQPGLLLSPVPTAATSDEPTPAAAGEPVAESTISSSVQPASPALNRVNPEAPAEDSSLAAAQEFIARVGTARSPTTGPLVGRGVSLLQVLSATTMSGERLTTVRQYWQLSRACADVSLAAEDAAVLRGLKASGVAHQQAKLTAALTAAQATREEALLAVLDWQLHLLALAPTMGQGELPVPTDRPFAGAYDTQFAVVFANRPAPAEAARIDRTLPQVRRVIAARAVAVAEAESSLAAVIQAYNDDLAMVTHVLEALQSLQHQRRSLLDCIYRYNHEIAQYAAIVADPTASHELVVSMLLPSQPRLKSVLVTPSKVQTTSGS